MHNEKLDIKSPYVRKKEDDTEEARRRIAKRAMNYSVEKRNTLSLSEKSREESDNLLEQKIQKVSKRTVGEEIRKFAEVASTEISDEFERLEKSLDKKIEVLEESIHNNLLLQNENFVISEENLEEKVNFKLFEINSALEQIENRIKDLEVFSLAESSRTEKVREEREIKNLKEKEEEEEGDYSLNLSFRSEKSEEEEKEKIEKIKEEKKEELKTEVKKQEEIKEDSENVCENDYDKKERYVKERMKKVIEQFEKNGFLFKKNIFLMFLEKLNAKDFLKEDKEIEGVDFKDKERMLDILNDLIDDSKSEPKKDETIKHFLKRVYRKEYENRG
ncbi:MAG TPA: hypothetical protein PLE26_00855 [Candidatus Paceibacterota bacterium]|nr:hypothetical protein [Candidatus Paceibacterota bacterium]HQB56891.1 hypothetical protein [Candidatus Paceibacterota bacterium]